MKIYEALYCGMTEESSTETLSIHRTKEGAQKAVRNHKAKEKRKWIKYQAWCKKDHPELYEIKHNSFGKFMWWGINETKLLD